MSKEVRDFKKYMSGHFKTERFPISFSVLEEIADYLKEFGKKIDKNLYQFKLEIFKDVRKFKEYRNVFFYYNSFTHDLIMILQKKNVTQINLKNLPTYFLEGILKQLVLEKE